MYINEPFSSCLMNTEHRKGLVFRAETHKEDWKVYLL